MNLLRGFFTFWYDFIIGDDWKIAAGVVVTLVVGALVVGAAAVPAALLVPLLGLGLAGAFAVSLVVDVRRR